MTENERYHHSFDFGCVRYRVGLVRCMVAGKGKGCHRAWPCVPCCLPFPLRLAALGKTLVKHEWVMRGGSMENNYPIPDAGKKILCRYCDMEMTGGDEATTHTYWSGAPFPCHTACKSVGEKREAYDCQLIDADCNDCLHFKRGSIVPHSLTVKTQIQAGDWPNFSTSIWRGHCLKFDRPASAYPKKWTGRECFEHRRKDENNPK